MLLEPFLADSSDEFIDIYNKSDIIISKGLENLEALTEEIGNACLVKTKCPMISWKLDVNFNEDVIKYNGENL
jgi:uncharacterized protein with ATP-grasp and redox domains